MGFFFSWIHAECSSFPQGLGGNSLIAELIDKLMTFFHRKRNSIVIAQAKAGQLIK